MDTTTKKYVFLEVAEQKQSSIVVERENGGDVSGERGTHVSS